MKDKKQVSLTLVTLLRYEYLNYCVEVAREVSSKAQFQEDENGNDIIDEKGLPISINSIIREAAMSTLEENGFYLGIRFVERLSLERSRITDQKEIIKFMCKDLWNYIFLKQADRLQTNRRGGYAILDNNFSWLKLLPNISRNNAKIQLEPAINVILVCGIIRGALQHLGLTCSVAAEVSKLPSCKFYDVIHWLYKSAKPNLSGTFQIKVYAPSKYNS
ncbi:transport protein particle component Bet3, putative [Cryptosporidium muris RN66]|uniref:Transport protein particle component Bet3, putative n=1 Tax=Cryptosporidium muris (strain RN66) TaxID=441375 RepID=B6AG61_CRYMR|nr:transport protein particle component Bet3, putative [Cryptosporidium muris RN66]EEA07202.1 transport protein particle component Bet3, putative [Cryptosporidium muris RN66]|eukprot:XP_002141551.1 transport protein particle component Bet3 [Cryptosporidium muris RN66]